MSKQEMRDFLDYVDRAFEQGDEQHLREFSSAFLEFSDNAGEASPCYKLLIGISNVLKIAPIENHHHYLSFKKSLKKELDI